MRQGFQPRVHGNGFIQLDLVGATKQRLHVWGDPRIPKQSTSTQHHDHRFEFKSEILRGCLKNTIWHFEPQTSENPGHFQVYHPRPRSGEDTELYATGLYGHLRSLSTQLLYTNCVYGISVGTIHTSVPVGVVTVTLMSKLDVMDGYVPQVFVPRGVDPSNAFDKHAAADPSLLWAIIENAIFVP